MINQDIVPTILDDSEDINLAEHFQEEKRPRRGGRVLPKDWTHDEFLERIARICKFELDKKGQYKELFVNGKRVFGEIWVVLGEAFRRYPSINRISLINCYITDNIFIEILNAIQNLLAVYSLVLRINFITQKSVQLLINAVRQYPQLQLLQTLDLRENYLKPKDGRKLFNALPNISELNGIPIGINKVLAKSHSSVPSLLNFSSHNIKAVEVSIICSLLRELPNIESLDLSRNSINSHGLLVLVRYLKKWNKSLTSIDISFNPLIEVENDEIGHELFAIEYLEHILKKVTIICNFTCTGCKIPLELEQSIQNSVEVNRTLKGRVQSNEKYFEDFSTQLAFSRSYSVPRDPLADWSPSLTADLSFAKRLGITKLNEIQISGDDIMLTNRFLFVGKRNS